MIVLPDKLCFPLYFDNNCWCLFNTDISLFFSGQTILNWENGIYEPKINQLIQLADLFGATVDYLIERKNNGKKADDICRELERIPKENIINFIKEETKRL